MKVRLMMGVALFTAAGGFVALAADGEISVKRGEQVSIVGEPGVPYAVPPGEKHLPKAET